MKKAIILISMFAFSAQAQSTPEAIEHAAWRQQMQLEEQMQAERRAAAAQQEVYYNQRNEQLMQQRQQNNQQLAPYGAPQPYYR